MPEHAIDSIKVVKPPDAKDKKALVAPLPAIDVAAQEARVGGLRGHGGGHGHAEPERVGGGAGLF